MGFEAIFGIAASCALIVMVVATFENLRAWGTSTGLKDTPLAVAFAIVTIAEMFNPVEPFEGIIIDFRVVPLALAGAFLKWHSAILVVASVCATRFGIGGQGVWAGTFSIVLAVASGVVWRHVFHRKGSFWSYFSLGLLGFLTLFGAFGLEPPIRNWFFVNAAPVLMLSYIALLPVFAWLIDFAPHIQSAGQRASGDTLRQHGVELLSFPAFLHHTRVGNLLNKSEDVAAVMAIRVFGLSRLFRSSSKVRPNDVLDAALVKLANSPVDISIASKFRSDTLLLPLTREQVRDLSGIRETIKTVLRSLPLKLCKTDRFWMSFELGLIRANELNDIERLRPIKLETRMATDPSNPETATRESTHQLEETSRFLPVTEIDLLFTKAELLSNSNTKKAT